MSAVRDSGAGDEAARADGFTTLGVVVPCRDEGRVIARKLANLALCRWPVSVRPHRVVVVDDGSADDTARVARSAAHGLTALGVEVRVLANDVRPGKPGAIAAGLQALEGVDLIVLTDADVVIESGALEALAAAFAARAELALACGAQRFVRSLAGDGRLSGEDGHELEDAAAPFDRWTARVRRLESRWGRLFSVHGQLLAWRADLGLTPTPGLAADDLDLMLQVRARSDPPRRVELVPAALFVETKPRDPAIRLAQEQRRATAYVQLVRAWDGRASGVQWWLYRYLPLVAPWLSIGLVAAVCVVATFWGVLGWLAVLALSITLATSGFGRDWLRKMQRIQEASRARAPGERWEMARR